MFRGQTEITVTVVLDLQCEMLTWKILISEILNETLFSTQN